jgi:hypothetical protein
MHHPSSKEERMKNLTETQKAYIAGLLDGEGCIGIDKNKSQASIWNYDFKIRIIITNSYSDVLFWIKEITGVGCVYLSKGAFKPNWRPIHRWQIVSEQARNFLIQIYPYLKIKKEIADIVLQLPVLQPQAKKFGRTKIEYNNQNRIFDLAKFKNRRGVNLLLKKE